MKAAAAGSKMRLENCLDARAERQVDIPDHRRARTRWSEAATRTHRGNTRNELGLAERTKFRRPIRTIHRATFFENRRPDIVATGKIANSSGKR